MKSIIGVFSAPRPHWVGDGFPVRTLFSYRDMAQQISPFLLLDHAGPAEFSPSPQPRGVGQHPHRGFETVTIVYQGELAHRDSNGGGGVIGPGDVQWMTAGSGILHEEFHSEAFTRAGGMLEMVQLWVNLPRRHKLAPPAYQSIRSADIPVLPLPADAGRLRLIAGDFAGRKGPARTFTGIDVWDLRLDAGMTVTLPLKAGRTALFIMIRGTALLGQTDVLRETQWALAGSTGTMLRIEANTHCSILVLSGEPIDEPIAGHGPFVMNTEAEIQAAFRDLQSGRFGQLIPLPHPAGHGGADGTGV
ncbi:quercetin 2,3-dioxygenase [Massilia sp. KIM]|uniref:pirin family protein n=1 Tax=Massilia sp. KIM TaxID=1955422 RepID=UPI00098F31D8|nr:pirin family protein [Massilia sp. KIM]OON59161.1 quercetin 2,3-dioxygenase [Massilia sp. KIM]